MGVLSLVGLLLAVHVGIILATPFPNLAGLLFPLVRLLIAVIIGGIFWVVIKTLVRVPGFYLWAAASSAFLILIVPLGIGKEGMIVVVALTVMAASLVGGGLAVLVRPVPAARAWQQRGLAATSLLLGSALIGLGVWWLLWDGPAAPHERAPEGPARGAQGGMPALTLPDPSQPGPYAVRWLFYGSGRDRHRSEYGESVDLRTLGVDASSIVGGWDGVVGWARTRYWGFDVRHLPLQARVSYPEGKGPFPLVLIVHGNHKAEEFSEAGYDYLGQLLASRGYIVASVDQNFLNLAIVDLVRVKDTGLTNEHRTRGWILLKHLGLWREWNGQAGNPFFGKVDMERIALIGHSLGGEAVAVATALNRLSFLPDDALVGLPHGFGIRSVVAFAPAQGGYYPAGNPTTLENVNYLALQGSYDFPVPSFDGARQFERVRFTDGGNWFKATVFIDRANHGQFNTDWGRFDSLGLGKGFLNLRPLLSGPEQRRIAQVYVSAFLDATLAGAQDYRTLFRDQRAAQALLPDFALLQQYQDASTRLVCTFEEDIDVTTTTLKGGKITAQNLSEWREGPVPMKWGRLGTQAAFLGWNGNDAEVAANYRITLPEAGLGLDQESVLTFRMADATRDNRTPLDLTIELRDVAGRTARLPLSSVSLLPPQFAAETLKSKIMSNVPRSEPVFRNFEFPLADFVASEREFQPTRLRTVGFVFDRSSSGRVILDDVGFRRGREPAAQP